MSQKFLLTLWLFASLSLQARELTIAETLDRIEEMISKEERGAYLCFSESDIRLANGQTGDLWDQIEIQDVLAMNEKAVLKSRFLPYTALYGHRSGERWSADLFNRVKDAWTDRYAPLPPAFLSTAGRKECTRFFRFLRSKNVLVVADMEIPQSTQTLLFGPGSRFLLSEQADEFQPQNYTVIVLSTDSYGKALSKRLLDQSGPTFIIDLSGLKEALQDWPTETWEKWVKKEPQIKFLYTSALIPYKFEERKGEYIQCLKILEKYGYKDRTYVVESGPYTPLSFFDDYCDHVFYANTNDTSFINKGVNEGKASLAAFDYYDFDDEDMIIKITGRYLFNDDRFVRLVEDHPEVDAFGSPHPKLGIVTGCFAMRSKYYKQMLRALDFNEMELKAIDIEREMEKFLKKMVAENANVVYLDKIGITANVANVVIEQW